MGRKALRLWASRQARRAQRCRQQNSRAPSWGKGHLWPAWPCSSVWPQPLARRYHFSHPYRCFSLWGTAWTTLCPFTCRGKHMHEKAIKTDILEKNSYPSSKEPIPSWKPAHHLKIKKPRSRVKDHYCPHPSYSTHSNPLLLTSDPEGSFHFLSAFSALEAANTEGTGAVLPSFLCHLLLGNSKALRQRVPEELPNSCPQSKKHFYTRQWNSLEASWYFTWRTKLTLSTAWAGATALAVYK